MGDFSSATAQTQFIEGLALYNSGHFFEAHEVLEDVWRSVPIDQPSKLHCQGIVQLAVAFHHHSTGNFIGAASVLDRALRNLDGAEETFPELNIVELRALLEPWQRYFSEVNHMKLPGAQNSPHANATAAEPSAPPLPIIRYAFTSRQPDL